MNTTKPKQQRSILSKQKILAAATELFALKGPDGARIDEIEARAGVNKQRIYAYFGSKESLYRQVLLDVYAQAAENEKLLDLQEEDLSQMTQAIIHCFLDFHQQHPNFWRLLAWENLNGGKTLSAKDWRNIQSNYITHLEKLYKRGQRIGVFDKKITFQAYLISVFAVTFFYYSNRVTMSHLLSVDMDKPDFQAKFADQVERLFTQGCSP